MDGARNKATGSVSQAGEDPPRIDPLQLADEATEIFNRQADEAQKELQRQADSAQAAINKGAGL